MSEDRHQGLTGLLAEAKVHVQRLVDANINERVCTVCGADHWRSHELWCFVGQACDWLERTEALKESGARSLGRRAGS